MVIRSVAEMDEHMTALYVHAQTGRIQKPERSSSWKTCWVQTGWVRWDKQVALGSSHPWEPAGETSKTALKSRVPAYPRDPDPTGELQPGADGGRGWG